MDQSYVNDLERLLNQATMGNTDLIKSATKKLREHIFKEPKCLPALAQIIQSSQATQIRQLAAVELRKQILPHWPKLPADLQAQVKTSILQSTLAEPVNLVKHASARVISAIAQRESESWKDLPHFLHQACLSSKPSDREMGTYILYTLFEVCNDAFMNRLVDCFALFRQTIVDPESIEVRMNTLIALGKISELLDGSSDKPNVKLFREAVPSMVNVLKEVVSSGDENMGKNCFEVFDTLLFVDGQLINKMIGDLVHLMIQIAQEKHLEACMRCMALSWLMNAIRFKRQKVSSLKIGEPLTLALLEIATEEYEEDPDDDNPAHRAIQCIDVLSNSLPPSHVFFPLIAALPNYVNHANPAYRRAAQNALAVSIEGASEHAISRLDEITPLLLTGLRDPDMSVRKAGLKCLCFMFIEMEVEIADKHELFMPIIFEHMTGQGEDASQSALAALDAVVDALKKDVIVAYLPNLMTKIIEILDSHASNSIKCIAACIGSIASSAQEHFLPYFERTMHSLSRYCQLHESEEDLELRGHVTGTIGAIAGAIGPQAFQPFLETSINVALDGLQYTNTKLREQTFVFFSMLAKAYNFDFCKYLPMIIPYLLESLDQSESNVDDEDIENNKDRTVESELSGEDGFVDVDDTESINSDLFTQLTAVHSAVAMEKEVAADVLAEIFAHTKNSFEPFLETTIQKLLSCTTHIYEGLRKNAIGALWRITGILYEMSSPAEWSPGYSQPPLHENVGKFADLVRGATWAMLEDEDDSTVVVEILRNMSEMIKLCGISILGNSTIPLNNSLMPDLEKVGELVLSILQRKAPFQLDDLGEAEESDDEGHVPLDPESAEAETLAIDCATDVVIALCKALGPSFSEDVKTFLPHIAQYYGSRKSLSERAFVIASLGGIADGLKEGVTPYTKDFLEMIVSALEDEEAEVRSNAAYSLGLVCLYTKEDLSNQYLPLLSRLQSFFGPGNHSRNAKDNAIGCLSRMILARPNCVPLDQVLAVIVQHLPLGEDYLENEPLFEMIISLYHSNDSNIMSLTEKLLPVFESVLSSTEEPITHSTRQNIVTLLQNLNNQFPNLISQQPTLVAAINP